MDNLKHKDEVVHVHCMNHKYEDGTIVKCNSCFCVKKGEVVLIDGENGSGKSTLINHIVGLLEPVKGEIRVLGEDVSSKEFENVKKDLGVVFQDVDEQLISPSVYEDIAFSMLNYRYPLKEIESKVDSIMKKLGISHLRNKVPHYLSGGEKKKVALAGAVVMEPKLLVLDEPFANIDPKSKTQIVNFLVELNKKGTAIIITSHEKEILTKLKPRIVHLK